MKSGEHAGRMLEYCAGRLSPEASREMESHVAVCDECAAFQLDHSRMWAAMDAWKPAPVSADFDRKLFARIEAFETAPWWERAGTAVRDFVRPLFAQPALAVSAATLVVAAGFFLDHPVRNAPAPNAPLKAHISLVDAAQVEATLEDMELLRQFDATGDEQEGSAKSI